MKRVITVLVLSSLILSGCAYGRSIYQGNNFKSELKDGEFTAVGKFYNSYGYKPSLTFWITKGIITRVNFTETDHNNIKRIDSDNASLKWNSCEYSYPEILDKLYTDTILTQGESVDAISGATKTVDDYEVLQKDLIKKIKSGYKEPVVVDDFNDIYVVQNDPDPISGSQEIMEIRYVDGQIKSVTVREVTNNAAFYAIGRVYESLADISEQNRNLEPIDNPQVDTVILTRYNELLDKARALIN